MKTTLALVAVLGLTAPALAANATADRSVAVAPFKLSARVINPRIEAIKQGEPHIAAVGGIKAMFVADDTQAAGTGPRGLMSVRVEDETTDAASGKAPQGLMSVPAEESNHPSAQRTETTTAPASTGTRSR